MEEDELDEGIFAGLPDRPLLTVKEVSKFMGVRKRTLYSWYPEKLQGTNLNGTLRFYRACVIELYKKRQEAEKDVK